MGFVIDQSGKYPKIKHIGGERFVRFNSLGPGYSPEEIFERIRYNEYPEFPEVPPQESPQQIFDGQTEPRCGYELHGGLSLLRYGFENHDGKTEHKQKNVLSCS